MEPHDPLLVRDGRPFGVSPGARAESLPFPYPSTVAGGLRSRAGTNEDGIFRYRRGDAALQQLKKIAIRGPFLVQLKTDGEGIGPEQWLLPAPHDASLLRPPEKKDGEKGKALLQPLVPLQLPAEAQTDLNQPAFLVGQPHSHDPRKPLDDAPAYWYWEHFQAWLLNPLVLAGRISASSLSVSDLGLRGPGEERRVHVSIDSEKQMAREGMLFETSGLEFTVSSTKEKSLWNTLRLAIAVVAEDGDYRVQPGPASFGGERRLVTWRKSSASLPVCPRDLEQQIIDARHCRIHLLTPACFEHGYLPEWLRKEAAKHGITIELKALAIKRPQVVSGWDLDLGKPKPSRRLAPAGTVLFLSLEGRDEALKEWVRGTWMQCISDTEQDRTDGFGLAVLGTWSGKSVSMQGGEAR
jgi:CRISPR-associated protein Cmr3